MLPFHKKSGVQIDGLAVDGRKVEGVCSCTYFEVVHD